ncbi:MAG: ABC transporter substrate-binding protein [Lachnospirales bacterium]
MTLRRFFSLILCFIILSGCSQTTTENSENTTEPTTEVVSAEKTITPVKGGSLKLCMNTPLTLNPLKNEDTTVDSVLKIIYEPLFNIDSSMNIIPNIAESYEVLGSTITIRVKDNIYWQDGKAIGADDVVYSLDTISDAGPNSMYKSCMLNISSYEQTGDKTLNIYYKDPVGAAIYNLTFPIIPKHYFKGNDEADMIPMGSGSFAYDSLKIAKQLNLKSCNGINGEPYISNIEVMLIGDEATRLSAAENGVIDVYCIGADELGDIKNDITSDAKLCTTNRFEFIGFNTRKSIFQTATLRQAMACIVPAESIIKGVYINNVTPSITPVNPDSVNTDLTGVDTYKNDLSTANTLILASGLTKNDFSFKILVNSENSMRVKSAGILSEAFNEFGFSTSVEQVSFEDYKAKLQSGDFDMYMGAVELMANMNVAQLVGTNGSVNFTGYSNSQVDDAINKVNSSVDFESYKKSLNELNKVLSYELPVVGIGFNKNAVVHSDRIKGEITPIFNNCYYNITRWFISE